MGIQYPEVLMDAAATLAQELERRGMAPEMASDAAFAAVEGLRARWGGADVYIPKAEHIELGPKHQQIYERWRAGEDYFQIKKDFDYSIQWIRQIVRTARLARSQKVLAPQLLQDCG
jgi:Mor family transcriptional regulator